MTQKIKCQIKHIFTSPDFQNQICGLDCGALIQKKMPITNFVNVLLACQTLVKRHYAAMLMERNTRKGKKIMSRLKFSFSRKMEHTLPKNSMKLQSQ